MLETMLLFYFVSIQYTYIPLNPKYANAGTIYECRFYKRRDISIIQQLIHSLSSTFSIRERWSEKHVIYTDKNDKYT